MRGVLIDRQLRSKCDVTVEWFSVSDDGAFVKISSFPRDLRRTSGRLMNIILAPGRKGIEKSYLRYLSGLVPHWHAIEGFAKYKSRSERGVKMPRAVIRVYASRGSSQEMLLRLCSSGPAAEIKRSTRANALILNPRRRNELVLLAFPLSSFASKML